MTTKENISEPHGPSELLTNWPVIAGVFVCLVFSIGTLVTYSFGVFAPELERAFGWSKSEVLLGFTFHNIGIVLGAPLAGLVVDRFGPRRVILISLIAFASLFYLLSKIGDATWQFYLILFAIPVAAGGVLPISYSQIIVSWFDRQRGVALGIALTGVGVGATILPPLSQYFIDQTGWRFAYASLATLALVVPLPVAFALLGTPAKPSPFFNARSASSAPKNASKFPPPANTSILSEDLRTMMLLVVFFFATGVPLTAAIVTLVPTLVDQGVTAQTAALAGSMLGVALIMGRIIVGLLLDRYQAKSVIAWLCVAPIAGFVLLALTDSTGLAFLAAAMIGFAVGAEVDLMAFMVSRYFAPQNFGKLYGFMFSALVIGGSIGPLIVARLRELSGSYDVGLLLNAAIMAVAIGVILLVPKAPESWSAQS